MILDLYLTHSRKGYFLMRNGARRISFSSPISLGGKRNEQRRELQRWQGSPEVYGRKRGVKSHAGRCLWVLGEEQMLR